MFCCGLKCTSWVALRRWRACLNDWKTSNESSTKLIIFSFRRKQCDDDFAMAEISVVDVEKLSSSMATSVSDSPGDCNSGAIQCLIGFNTKFSNAGYFPQSTNLGGARLKQHNWNIVRSSLSSIFIVCLTFLTTFSETWRRASLPWKFFLCKLLLINKFRFYFKYSSQ